MTPTISTSGLTRRYRGQLALDEVTLDFDGPSITGLLGRNGAGKTTLMRIIAAQELASAGTVRVLGASPVENDAVPGDALWIRRIAPAAPSRRRGRAGCGPSPRRLSAAQRSH